jgi:DNA-binding transcriptional LysR family regulator
MELRAIRYFLAAAETENLTRASERLNVVQSALSHQIRGLEEELGAQLFHRHGRRIRLSPLGEMFARDARKILEAVEFARRRVRRAAEGALGEVRVGFETLSSRNRLVSEALFAFREASPEVTMDLVHMPAGPLLDAIRQGEVDAGFVHLSEVYPELDTVAFQTTDWVLAIPWSHRLAKQVSIRLKDLAGEPFIWRDRAVSPLVYDRMLALCRAGGLTPNIVQEANNDVMMINLVSVGLGVCFVAESLHAKTPSDPVAFRKVEDFSMPLELCLAWRRDSLSLPLPNLAAIVRRLAQA